MKAFSLFTILLFFTFSLFSDNYETCIKLPNSDSAPEICKKNKSISLTPPCLLELLKRDENVKLSRTEKYFFEKRWKDFFLNMENNDQLKLAPCTEITDKNKMVFYFDDERNFCFKNSIFIDINLKKMLPKLSHLASKLSSNYCNRNRIQLTSGDNPQCSYKQQSIECIIKRLRDTKNKDSEIGVFRISSSPTQFKRIEGNFYKNQNEKFCDLTKEYDPVDLANIVKSYFKDSLYCNEESIMTSNLKNIDGALLCMYLKFIPKLVSSGSSESYGPFTDLKGAVTAIIGICHGADSNYDTKNRAINNLITQLQQISDKNCQFKDLKP